MKGKFRGCFFCTLLASMIFCISAPSFAAAKGHVLSHIMNSDHYFHRVSQVFINKLNELSGESMKIEYHLGGDLGDWTVQLDQAMQGIIPMTLTWNNSELDPKLDLAILGFVAEDWKSARRIYGPGGTLEPEFEKMFERLNLTVLGTVPQGFAGYVVRKGLKVPLNVPEDARGFKMRVPQFVMGIERYKALGFSPVTIPFSELHTALQTGSVDGRAYGPASEIRMFADILEAFVYTREHIDFTFLVANRKWLSQLSKDEQAWVKKAGSYASDWAWKNIEAEEKKKLEESKQLGVKVIRPNAEQMKKYKTLVRNAEWPIFEKIAGKELMDKVRKAANTQ